MLLRMLRGPAPGRTGPLARMIAVLVLIGMIGVTGPVLLVAARWVADLL